MIDLDGNIADNANDRLDTPVTEAFFPLSFFYGFLIIAAFWHGMRKKSKY